MYHKRTLVSANSPVYADPANKTVRLKCVFAEIESFGEVDFLATPNDIEPHGREILASALAGQFGGIGPYVPPSP
jgi:hypothetical protein